MARDFQLQQKAFTTRIRQGNKVPCPQGIAENRMRVYEEGFLNGMRELLSNCFPIVHEILQEKEWQAIVRNFYATHPSKTPLFYEIPQEFLNYLLQTKPLLDRYPFLIELAHYEWMEIALDTAPGDPPKATLDTLDFNNTQLAVSDLAEVVGYHFAVHRINPDYLPSHEAQQTTYLCIYRNVDDEVQFIELNALNARLLLRLKDKPQGVISAMKALTQEMACANAEELIEKNLRIVKQLLAQGVLYPLNSKQEGA